MNIYSRVEQQSARMAHNQEVEGASPSSASSITDSQRERLIEACRVIVELHPTESCKNLAWGWMQRLIKGRSGRQVAKMEAERGLR